MRCGQLVALIVVVGGCGSSNESSAPSSPDGGPPDDTCAQPTCATAPTCTPTTCAAQSKTCGTIPDGCGGALDCGTCPDSGGPPGPGGTGTSPEEFHGPFGSWTVVGPSGDVTGATDYANIQAKLNALGRTSGTVLYLAAGTYYINRTLALGIGSPAGATVGVLGATILGHSRGDTTIKWVGSAPTAGGATNAAIMFKHNGVSQMRFGRLMFDGGSLASVAVMDAWDNSGNYFPTNNRYEDLVVVHLNPASPIGGPQSETAALALGVLGYGASETTIVRNLYNYARTGGNAEVVGAMTYNYNSLDNWFWDSQFIGMQEGITDYTDNSNFAGDFCADRCAFATTQRDLMFVNLGTTYSSRWNYSKGAWRHVEGGPMGNFSSNMTVQGCTIAGTSTTPIQMGVAGPAGMLDNHIWNNSDHSNKPDVLAACAYDTDNASGEEWGIGNVYENAAPYYLSPATQLHSVDDLTGQSPGTGPLVDPGFPAMTPEPPAVARKVYEPSGFTGAAIQAAIDQAHADGSPSPVVHLAAGTYAVGATIAVPANWPVFIEGDGMAVSNVQWQSAGAGPVLEFNGPSLALARDFGVDGGGSADAIVATGQDTAGGVVHLEGCSIDTSASVGGVLATNLPHTVVDLLNGGFGVNPDNANAYGVSSENGSTIHWVNGASGNRIGPLYQVRSGGTLVAADVYAENGDRPTTVVAPNSDGTLNVDGSRIVGGNVVLDLSTFKGSATFTDMSLAQLTKGQVTVGENSLFLGVTLPNGSPYTIPTGVASYAVLEPRENDQAAGTSTQLPEASAGVTDIPGYLKSHLAPLRALKPKDLATPAVGTNQLILIRVSTSRERVGFTFEN